MHANGVILAGWSALLLGCGSSVSTVGAGGAGGEAGAGGRFIAEPSSGLGGSAPQIASGGTQTSSSAGTTVPSAVSSTASGGLVCEGGGDCLSCVRCAWNAPCQALAATCFANFDCLSMLQCYEACDDDDCETACWFPYPYGQAAYLALTACTYCDHCPSDCPSADFGCSAD